MATELTTCTTRLAVAEVRFEQDGRLASRTVVEQIIHRTKDDRSEGRGPGGIGHHDGEAEDSDARE